MKSEILLDAIGEIRDDYIMDANKEVIRARRSNIRPRRYLIAAIIALLAFSMVYAVHVYRVQHLVVIDRDAEINQTSKAEQTIDQELYVSEQVLSMNGYEGSQAYSALQEWLNYEIKYMGEHPEYKFRDDYRRPDEYELYPCYSQEMVDKVNELCNKYGLHLLGTGIFLKDETEMEKHGLANVLIPDTECRCLYGHLHKDGSFIAEGELVVGEFDKVVQFQMHHVKKDAFYTNAIGINDLYDFIQWDYTTKNGTQTLIAQNPHTGTGYIFTETLDSFITIIVEEVPDANEAFYGLPKEAIFLESVCDSFVLD